MVTTSFPTCISLSFGHCPLRKTIRRWKRLKNQIEPIKDSLANILGASGSVPHICFFHSTIPRNWEHGGRNMAVSLGLGKRLLLPQMKSQVSSWMYLACFCNPCDSQSILQVFIEGLPMAPPLCQVGTMARGPRMHRPMDLSLNHTLQPHDFHRRV